VDVRVSVPENFDLAVLKQAQAVLALDYPKVGERHYIELTSEIATQTSSVTQKKVTTLAGYVFSSSDDRQVVQFRRDGFTFSRLSPYTNWKTVVREAMRLWQIYIKAARPITATRIALRYINHLELKCPVHEVHRFLEYRPNLPATVPEHVRSSFSRLLVQGYPNSISAFITQAIEALESDKTKVLLDNDVFREGLFSLDEQEISRVLEDLHAIKNDIFFASIKDETARLYQ